MAQLNVNLNATLEIDDDTWYELLEAYEGDENDAVNDLVESLDGTDIHNYYGEAWIAFAEDGGWIHPPSEDTRPL